MIDLQDVTHTFHAEGRLTTALTDITAQVDDREFVSIVGPSGCGKSTLLRIVAGLLPPSRGQVVVDGTAVSEPLGDIGFVFQKPVLFQWRTALDNVLFPYEVRAQQDKAMRARREEFRERARSLLDLVGLSGFEKAYPRELSGGMGQRVAICRALLLDPAFLLMDEPFGAVDEFTRDRLNVELLRIWEGTDKTVLFVTHHLPEAVFLSDRVIVLSAHPGRVVADITISLDRPRRPAIRDSVAFLEETLRVRKHLQFDETPSRA
ncbi:MAG: ATP-binding cassette domain-containing protein [Streptosporangiales bacterium]|nr:ATP-binding cassette domain-containing protein [Streptosporangiales bacterium]